LGCRFVIWCGLLRCIVRLVGLDLIAFAFGCTFVGLPTLPPYSWITDLPWDPFLADCPGLVPFPFALYVVTLLDIRVGCPVCPLLTHGLDSPPHLYIPHTLPLHTFTHSYLWICPHTHGRSHVVRSRIWPCLAFGLDCLWLVYLWLLFEPCGYVVMVVPWIAHGFAHGLPLALPQLQLPHTRPSRLHICRFPLGLF